MTTEMEILNVPVVSQILNDRGLKTGWVIQQLGMKRTAGYIMFRNGVLPSDQASRKEVLAKLSKLLGLPLPQIVVSLPRPRRTA